MTGGTTTGTGRGPDEGRHTRSSTPKASTPLGRERPTPTSLLSKAKELRDITALALTDTNLCGALEFARLANDLGIRPITGGELTLTDDSRLTLLAQTRAGYSNISRLFTLANAADRRNPRLDPTYLPHHSEGVVLLTGGRDGPLSRLAMEGRIGEASGSCSGNTWTGSVPALCTWNSSRTYCRETRTATGDWRE